MKPDSEAKRRTVDQIEGFINLLRAACDDQKLNATIEKLLSLTNEKRHALIYSWVSDLLVNQAPKEFTEAIACLLDDAVAEKAYEVIFQCRR